MSPLASFSVRSGRGPWAFLADLDLAAPTVVAATLGSADDLLARLTQGERERGVKASRDAAGLAMLLREYFAGDVRAIDRIPVSQPGSDFKQGVWRHMRKVRGGSVASYAELAAAAGNSSAVRASASACATNRVPLIVPCHRILRTGGALGNYYYGVDVKRWLLEHEGAIAPA